MPNPVLLAPYNRSYLHRVGRVGLDSGTRDGQTTGGAGGVAYTGFLRTERFSPLGEGGKAHFRRVVIRVLFTGCFTCKLRAYVDDAQTQRWDNVANQKVDQEVTFTKCTQVQETEEAILEMAIDAVGTWISVELEVTSTSVQGTFLPESVEVHLYPISRSLGSSQAKAV